MTMSFNLALWFLMIIYDWAILAMAERQFCFDKKKELCKKVSTTYSTYQKNIFYINVLKESYLSKLCSVISTIVSCLIFQQNTLIAMGDGIFTNK